MSSVNPAYNWKQAIIRSFKAGATLALDALRVCVINTAANPVPVTVIEGGGSGDTTPIIYNITLGAINTEQSQALPTNCKGFTIKSREAAELKLAYAENDSGSNYITIKRRAFFKDENFYENQTIYFQSPQTGDVVEIVAYS